MSKPCSFCQRESIEPPCEGSKAVGSYRDITTWETTRPKVFNGYLCDFHIDNVEWISLKVNGKYLYRGNRRIN
jgi:hypothetical protein